MKSYHPPIAMPAKTTHIVGFLPFMKASLPCSIIILASAQVQITFLVNVIEDPIETSAHDVSSYKAVHAPNTDRA